MKKYRVDIFDDPTGMDDPEWLLAGSYASEDDARAYAEQWRMLSPEITHRIVSQEIIAEYRAEDRL